MEARSLPWPRLLARVLAYLRPHRARFGLGIGFTFVGLLLDLSKPLPLAFVLDNILDAKPLPKWLGRFAALPPAELLGAACLAMVSLALLRGLVTLASNSLTIDVGQRMVGDLRTALYAHLQKLSLKFHYRQQTGDLLFRVMADTFSIQGLVMNGLLPLTHASLMLLGMFLVMLQYDAKMAVVALCVGPPLYVAVSRLSVRITGHAAASREAESALYGRAETVLGAVKLVQAYGREELAVRDFRRGSDNSLALSLRLYQTETLFMLVVDTVLAVGTALLVWLGARSVMAGTLTIGALTVFLGYLREMYTPVLTVAQNFKEISSARAGLDRAFAVLDVEADIKDAPDARALPEVKGEIR
ncbi:MAG TPA: ABC transporter transmembrane domain-containing protein, partial [Vicinamibacteria bacterium]